MARPSPTQSAGSSERRITAINLSHGFRSAPALFEGLNFSHVPGDIVGLCGPSGSGKSTLLSILAGWERPLEGRVATEGITIIGWVFQNPHGISHRTVLDHAVFPLLAQGLRRTDADADALRVLSKFGLADVATHPFHTLSGGEAQRLMLARAVCAAPDLLLVDEPTAQLDQATARTVNATLGGIADGGSIVMIATHDSGTRASCTHTIDLTDYPPSRKEQ